jgi:hypothetical protein
MPSTTSKKGSHTVLLAKPTAPFLATSSHKTISSFASLTSWSKVELSRSNVQAFRSSQIHPSPAIATAAVSFLWLRGCRPVRESHQLVNLDTLKKPPIYRGSTFLTLQQKRYNHVCYKKIPLAAFCTIARTIMAASLPARGKQASERVKPNRCEISPRAHPPPPSPRPRARCSRLPGKPTAAGEAEGKIHWVQLY